MKECLRRLNVKAALNACAKKAVSIRQEAAWQLHSRMRQACSSRLHARNCFQCGPNCQIVRPIIASSLLMVNPSMIAWNEAWHMAQIQDHTITPAKAVGCLVSIGTGK